MFSKRLKQTRTCGTSVSHWLCCGKQSHDCCCFVCFVSLYFVVQYVWNLMCTVPMYAEVWLKSRLAVFSFIISLKKRKKSLTRLQRIINVLDSTCSNQLITKKTYNSDLTIATTSVVHADNPIHSKLIITATNGNTFVGSIFYDNES